MLSAFVDSLLGGGWCFLRVLCGYSFLFVGESFLSSLCMVLGCVLFSPFSLSHHFVFGCFFLGEG